MNKFGLVFCQLFKVEDADDIQNVPASVSSGSEVKDEKSTKHDIQREGVKETGSTIDTSELPPHTILGMPALSPTMDQGNIAKWRKKEGDKIEVDNIICEIETDKATLEFETLDEGYLAKILAPEGSKEVAVILDVDKVEDPQDIEVVKNSASGSTRTKEGKSAHHKSKSEPREQKGSFTKISPSVQLLISEYGLDESNKTLGFVKIVCL
ncbi:hypothetical protein K2173_014974 [Erythroxylum novogranatense]|uniref:Lipoyl-binding domain-containing protein n=1 Tax=Erythroxylum novogranatense TaxID=1862640 RepID=A0AAV8S6J6_9ROSI|nr:hypothetical protein K2173_014974 [Erythroxylum novogranatense]